MATRKAQTNGSGAPSPARSRAAQPTTISGDLVQGDKVGRDKINQQFNTDGGAAILRKVTATTFIGRDQIKNFYTLERIDWPKASEQTYLKRVVAEFEQQISERVTNRAGTTLRTAAALYVEPLLSARHTRRKQEQGTVTNRRAQIGIWQDLVKAGQYLGLLVGDTYDGKSLLLKKIAHDTAQRALQAKRARQRELPIYLSVYRYPFPDADGLLDLAAAASGQRKESLHEMWRKGTRRIALLIDDADLIPPAEVGNFVNAIKQLQNSLGESHRLLIACRVGVSQGSLKDQLMQALEAEPRFTEWIILPFNREQIELLLERYGAVAWLRELIFTHKNLEVLVTRPGMLAALVRATRGLSVVTPPENLAQLYNLFIDGHLLARESAQAQYLYRQVKRRLLAFFAYRMLIRRTNNLVIDDDFLKEIAERLEILANEFHNTRRVMPREWLAAEFLGELFELPVINSGAARDDLIEFASPIYRDYYAALYLNQIGQQWQQAAEEIRRSTLTEWLDVLILLSGMPANDYATQLMNDVLASTPGLAADIWLEKGTVGISRVPECVTRDYNTRRPYIPDQLDLPQHPAANYLRRIADEGQPRIALQAVNGLMQLGVDAIDPLLAIIEASHPIVTASAIHALFHMGELIATGVQAATPLFACHGEGFSFSNMGACNATIGNLVLVQAPRTFRAELQATFEQVDFDPFATTVNFQLWHTPVAWFAINYFKTMNTVDWVGLAGACNAIARCAGLIVGKALPRSRLTPIVEEMTQCAISYERLGFFIANDLGLPWQSNTPADAPQWLIDNTFLVYKELRLFFNRPNRALMLAQLQASAESLPSFNVTQTVQENRGTILGVELNAIRANEDTEADLPSLTQVGYAQTISAVTDGSVCGIHVKQIMPGKFLAAEVVSLSGSLTIDSCTNGTIAGIIVDEVDRWDGIRIHLALTIGELKSSRLVGIQVTPPQQAIQSP